MIFNHRIGKGWKLVWSQKYNSGPTNRTILCGWWLSPLIYKNHIELYKILLGGEKFGESTVYECYIERSKIVVVQLLYNVHVGEGGTHSYGIANKVAGHIPARV